MNDGPILFGLFILGFVALGGVTWVGWSIVDLIRYTTISDEELQQKSFPKPSVTRLAQQPSGPVLPANGSQYPIQCSSPCIEQLLPCRLFQIAISFFIVGQPYRNHSDQA